MRVLGIGFGILIIGVIYFLIDPAKVKMPECPFYALTNLFCPGCGSQRGLHALLHGRVITAFGYNPLMVISLVFFILEAGIWILNKRGAQIRALSVRRNTPMIVLVITLIFWALRNIPVWPFSLLAP